MSNSPNKMILLYSPFPSQAEAEKAASRLLSDKLIACANILSPGKSMYFWEGELKEESEVYVLFKTSKELAETASQRLVEIHPYKVPAVIRLKATANTAFTKWLTEVTTGRTL